MTTLEENETFTRVGPGTPAGNLLRRYWHPVATAGELTEEKPIKQVKLLGEELVVFRLRPRHGESQIRYGLIALQCRHRRASMAYGRVDDEGIRCPYHGWKYDVRGRCVEQPAEPPDSTFKSRIHQPAYPVQRLAGLLFAYMGPEPAPLLPRWDVLVREDGKRRVVIESVMDCNWVQPMENSVDPAHFHWLHGSLSAPGALGPRYLGKYQEQHQFIAFEYGILKRRITPGKNPADPPMVDEHPMIFPTILRLDLDVRDANQKVQAIQHIIQLRVPIDDTHTKVYRIDFTPSATDRSPPDEEPSYEYCALKNAAGEYNMEIVTAQDSMAWETQGAITDRTQEHLATSDRGVVMFRRMLKEQIEIVRNGGDPMGVVRDPAKNKIIELDSINERIGLYRSSEGTNELNT
ncbi:MAG: Rieske 2Fe-2S domain-containing protein [Burkholderiales bacterium]